MVVRPRKFFLSLRKILKIVCATLNVCILTSFSVFFLMIFTYYVILGVIFTLFLKTQAFTAQKNPLLECLGGDLIINRIYASSQTYLKQIYWSYMIGKKGMDRKQLKYRHWPKNLSQIVKFTITKKMNWQKKSLITSSSPSFQ